jgi:hypothetical protein
MITDGYTFTNKQTNKQTSKQTNKQEVSCIVVHCCVWLKSLNNNTGTSVSLKATVAPLDLVYVFVFVFCCLEMTPMFFPLWH